MAERTCARDLMSRSFRRIDPSLTLRAAIVLMTVRENACPALVAVSDGQVAGLLTPRLLLRELLSHGLPGRPSSGGQNSEERVLDVARGRLDDPVRDLLAVDVPSASPDDGLLRLMELTGDERRGCVPVVEDGKPVGIVWAADVFHNAAILALAPKTADESGESSEPG